MNSAPLGVPELTLQVCRTVSPPRKAADRMEVQLEQRGRKGREEEMFAPSRTHVGRHLCISVCSTCEVGGVHHGLVTQRG